MRAVLLDGLKHLLSRSGVKQVRVLNHLPACQGEEMGVWLQERRAE
jgi:hypothetical protein